MSNNAKIITWIVVAIVVVGGIWWWYAMSQTGGPQVPYQAGPTQAPPNSPANANPGTNNGGNNGVSASGDSNAAIQSNLSSTDGQMNGFSSDNTNMNQGLNDQPVQQEPVQ